MPRYGVLLFITVLAAGCQSKPAATSPQNVWSEFAHAAGRFTVEMPGKPKEHQQTVPTEKGEYKLVSNILELPGQKKSFAVIFSDYPPDPAYERESHAVRSIDDAIVGMVRTLRGRLDKKTRVTIGGFQGQEFTIILVDSGEMLQGRIYLVKNRLYQVFSSWSEANGDTSADAERFVQSFRLTD